MHLGLSILDRLEVLLRTRLSMGLIYKDLNLKKTETDEIGEFYCKFLEKSY